MDHTNGRHSGTVLVDGLVRLDRWAPPKISFNPASRDSDPSADPASRDKEYTLSDFKKDYSQDYLPKMSRFGPEAASSKTSNHLSSHFSLDGLVRLDRWAPPREPRVGEPTAETPSSRKPRVGEPTAETPSSRKPRVGEPTAESRNIPFKDLSQNLKRTTPKTTCQKCRGLLPRPHQVKHQTIYRHIFL